MELVTVAAAARILECSVTHVYRLLESGIIAELRDGRKHYILKQSLDEFVAKYGRFATPTMSYIRLVNENPELFESNTKKN